MVFTGRIGRVSANKTHLILRLSSPVSLVQLNRLYMSAILLVIPGALSLEYPSTVWGELRFQKYPGYQEARFLLTGKCWSDFLVAGCANRMVREYVTRALLFECRTG